ncbi:MAG: TIGR03915 family putative DNA repair protein [Lachnospiraceae bacterium]
MKIFTCKDIFEDMMCCIYDAWAEGIRIGHENIGIRKEPVLQQTLFDEYIHVDYDEEKYEKVVRSIKGKLSTQIYIDIYYVAMSFEEDALDTIYAYLRLGFKQGPSIRTAYTNPPVMRMMEIRRRVGNETHYFQEFVRFISPDSKIYISHIEPKNNVALLVGNIFVDRMPSENFMIVDDNRKFAVVHPKNEDIYIQILTDEQLKALQELEKQEDDYMDMWRGFFHAIAIEQRKNEACQRNHFPKWMRKHVTEFME